jgi:hypothetical protein
MPTITLVQTKSAPLPENGRIGVLQEIDTANSSLTLKPKAGPAATYRVIDSTQVYREKRPAKLEDFKLGDEAVIRMRKAKTAPVPLMDLCDRVSWDWLVHLRKDTVKVTILELTEDDLKAKIEADGSEMTYRITDKTVWQKAGQPVTREAFKAGASAFIAPILLSNGRIKAVAVTDAGGETVKLKERLKPTVSGKVISYDGTTRHLKLHTTAGDERELTLAVSCEVRKTGKPVTTAALVPGVDFTAHLRKGEDGERVVVKITVKDAKDIRVKKAPAVKPIMDSKSKPRRP